MSNNKKILLLGMKPTGRVHIGNYFGAMKQFVENHGGKIWAESEGRGKGSIFYAVFELVG
jgi:signal transduction histidine kinase